MGYSPIAHLHTYEWYNHSMAIGVVEFSRKGHKIRKDFAKKSTYPGQMFEF